MEVVKLGSLTGISGYSGFSGYMGNSGYSGYSSFSGYSGYSGKDGTDGLSGYSGYSGSGYSGYSGLGFSGYSGYSGVGSSITFGTPTQIPYMNAGGTDFLYGAGLTYDGTYLLSPSIIGSSADNGDITIQGTSSATKTSSYVILQPTGGNVGIGTTGPSQKLEVAGGLTKLSGGLLSPYTNVVVVSPDGKGDYTTITSAIAAFPSGGVTIELMPGTYVESGITIPSNTEIRGSGIDISIWKNTASNTTLFDSSAATNVAIKNMTVWWNVAGNSPVAWTSLNMSTTTYLVDCYLYSSAQSNFARSYNGIVIGGEVNGIMSWSGQIYSSKLTTLPIVTPSGTNSWKLFNPYSSSSIQIGTGPTIIAGVLTGTTTLYDVGSSSKTNLILGSDLTSVTAVFNGGGNIVNSLVRTFNVPAGWTGPTGWAGFYNSSINTFNGGDGSGFAKLYNTSIFGLSGTIGNTQLQAQIDYAPKKYAAANANYTPIIIKGATSQVANLFQWQDSSSTPLGGIDNNGKVGIGTTTPGEKLEVNGNIQLTADNNILKFGTGEDAHIYYDATNLIINPKVVGTGYLNILGQLLMDDKIMFTQTDGNEYIDSLTDGELDLGATTAINLRSDTVFVGSGTGLPYGEIYVDNGTETKLLTTSYSQITNFDTEGTDGISNLVTPAKASNKITITKAGTYRVSFSFSGITTKVSPVYIAVFIDGTEQNNIEGSATGVENGFISISANGLVTIAANKDIDLRAKYITGADAPTITLSHININVVMIGG